jgi:hypothetical protein
MVVPLQLPVQSMPITTKVVSLNPVHDEMYLNVKDLRRIMVGGCQVMAKVSIPIGQVS